jgi:hypothetical protein
MLQRHRGEAEAPITAGACYRGWLGSRTIGVHTGCRATAAARLPTPWKSLSAEAILAFRC